MKSIYTLDGCSPLEIQFVNHSQWATQFLWDFGDYCENGSPDSMAGDITLLWKRPQ